ncbi:MAG: hypothetical protein PHU88_05660 [candidate division Zixibacteria bacterium]|nr:hypothetical protein [candidate division Zixibacteria bacterium]MDD5426231.1 hypothetical protein [candidate division Zixibacteria bacterium]
MHLRQLKLPELITFNCRNRIIKYSGFILLTLTLVFAAGMGKEIRPQYHDVALAFPRQGPAIDTSMFFPYVTNRLYMTLILEVDKKGMVSSVSPVEAGDSNYAGYYSAYLKTLIFEPGKYKGKKTKQIIPVNLFYKPKRRVPELVFPVNAERKVLNRSFYFYALKLNEIQIPEIVYFPSYNYLKKIPLTEGIYPYALFKIKLDKDGRPVDIKYIRGNSSAYISQILSAVNWGKYTPLQLQGKNQPSENYLLFSFLPHDSYPVMEIDYRVNSSLSLLERIRVRLLPDTVGLLTEPLSVNIDNDEFICSDSKVIVKGEVTARVLVDTLGKVKLTGLSSSNKRLNAAVISLLSYLDFYPALDNSGLKIPFNGELDIEFTGSRRVKIHIKWLF